MPRKRKKRTADEIARHREWRRRSDENLRRLYELVEKGWADLEDRRRREGTKA